MEGPPSFVNMSPLELLVNVLVSNLVSYHEQRLPHHARHGVEEEDLRIMPIIMSVSEMEFMLQYFKDNEIPDMLCPLLSEINHALESHTMVAPKQDYGDPRNN